MQCSWRWCKTELWFRRNARFQTIARQLTQNYTIESFSNAGSPPRKYRHCLKNEKLTMGLKTRKQRFGAKYQKLLNQFLQQRSKKIGIIEHTHLCIDSVDLSILLVDLVTHVDRHVFEVTDDPRNLHQILFHLHLAVVVRYSKHTTAFQ